MGVVDLTTEYLYQREVDRVLAALMPQNQLIVKVMLHTGMRLSDALRMPSEALVSSGWYTEGKTGKKRRYVRMGGPWPQGGDAQDASGRLGGHQAGIQGVPAETECRGPLHAQGLCGPSHAQVWRPGAGSPESQSQLQQHYRHLRYGGCSP